MKIEIISVGKFQNSSYQVIFSEYQKRLKNVEIKEIATKHSAKTPIDVVKKEEAIAIKKIIADRSFVICLDERGAQYDSCEFAKLVKTVAEDRGQNITFVIGGAFGLDFDLVKSADKVLSLGKMTLPHMMARIMLIEQIYRASTINSGHPYHKE